MKKLSEHERAFLVKMQAEAEELAGKQEALYCRICRTLGLAPYGLPNGDEELAVLAFVFDHRDAEKLEASLARTRNSIEADVLLGQGGVRR